MHIIKIIKSIISIIGIPKAVRAEEYTVSGALDDIV